MGAVKLKNVVKTRERKRLDMGKALLTQAPPGYRREYLQVRPSGQK